MNFIFDSKAQTIEDRTSDWIAYMGNTVSEQSDDPYWDLANGVRDGFEIDGLTEKLTII